MPELPGMIDLEGETPPTIPEGRKWYDICISDRHLAVGAMGFAFVFGAGLAQCKTIPAALIYCVLLGIPCMAFIRRFFRKGE